VSLLTRPISLGTRGVTRYGRRVWVAWALVRFAGLVAMTNRTGYPSGDNDVFRYGRWAALLHAGHLPWSSFPVEYPPGVLPFLALPGGLFTYELQFIVLAFVADAIILAMLRRTSPRGLGQWLWLVAPVALGTTLWLRFDIFVAAALVGFVVAIRSGRWRIAGACLAYACLLKLWPLVILVVAWRVIPAEGRRRVTGWCLGVIAGATLPVIAWGGASGLLAMLGYQGNRGLEVESVAAYPFMLAWSLGHHSAPVIGHVTLEFDVFGVVALVATVALPAALACLSAVVWRDAGARASIASVTLVCALVVLVASKVMSAQYIVWVLALTALAVDDHVSVHTWPRWRLAVVATTGAALTQWIFPLNWGKVILEGGTAVMVVLTVRLLVLAVWLVLAWRYAFAQRAGSDLLRADQAPAVEALSQHGRRLVVQQG
jgi:Glycosyltransferase family 87